MTWTQQPHPHSLCCFLPTPAVYECQDKPFWCLSSSLSSHLADGSCSASSQPSPSKRAPSPCATGAASCSPPCSKLESLQEPLEADRHYLFACISLLGTVCREPALLPHEKAGCLLCRHQGGSATALLAAYMTFLAGEMGQGQKKHLEVDKQLHHWTSASPTSTLALWVHLGEHKSSQSKRAKRLMEELLEALEDSSQPLIVLLWLRA